MRSFLLLILIICHPLVSHGEVPVLKVGISLPLSGPLTEFGEAVRNGIELARKEQPVLREKIKFLYEDNAYDAKRAIANLQKLVDVDHVDLFVVWGAEPALSVSPVAEQRKVPTIAITQHPQTCLGREYIIRFINSGYQYSETLLSFLRHHKIRRLAIIKAELSFFDMLLDGLKQGADKESIEIVDAFLPSETDFRSTIVKLKSKKFDLLGVYLNSSQVGLFFKQAHELGFHPRTFGATTFETKSVLTSVWPLMEGAVYTHNAVTETFRKRYLLQFGTDMQLAYAANSYDFATLTGKLFSHYEKSPNAEAILAAFSKAEPAVGASGPYRFVNSPTGGKHFDFDIVIRKIQGDSTEEVFRNHYGSGPIE